MTRAEVAELLDKLELSSNMRDYDVRDRIEELGYRHLVRVYDGATKICLVFTDNTDFIVKWSYNCDDDNSESVKECRIYACAVEAGLDFFFPKTEIMGGNGEMLRLSYKIRLTILYVIVVGIRKTIIRKLLVLFHVGFLRKWKEVSV